MANHTTYIKIDRNIIYWRWFQNSKILSVFLWLLVKANIKDGSFEKETIHRGSLITSNAHIAEGCGLTINNVRTALANLEETGEIVRTVRNHYQFITIVNYESYQSDITKTRGQPTSNLDGNLDGNSQQSKNGNNGNNGKNKPPKSPNGGQSPDGEIKRGTKLWKARSHLLLKRDEGTVDDIPDFYRDGTYQSFISFAEYWDWRNQ